MKKEIQIAIGLTSPLTLMLFNNLRNLQINDMQSFTLGVFMAGISFIYIAVLITIIIDLSKWLFIQQRTIKGIKEGKNGI